MDKNKVGIIITSHGNLCKEIVLSAEMIVGNQLNVTAIPLTDSGISDFQKELSNQLEIACLKYDEIIILTDIKNATPYNTSLLYMAEHPKHKIHILSGYNLPIIIELLISIQYSENINELLEDTISSGKESMAYMNFETFSNCF